MVYGKYCKQAIPGALNYCANTNTVLIFSIDPQTVLLRGTDIFVFAIKTDGLFTDSQLIIFNYQYLRRIVAGKIIHGREAPSMSLISNLDSPPTSYNVHSTIGNYPKTLLRYHKKEIQPFSLVPYRWGKNLSDTDDMICIIELVSIQWAFVDRCWNIFTHRWNKSLDGKQTTGGDVSIEGLRRRLQRPGLV